VALVVVVGLVAATTTPGAVHPTQGRTGAATTTVAAPAALPVPPSTTMVEEPETLLATEVPPPLLMQGIDATTPPPPSLPVRTVHGCDAAAEPMCTKAAPPPRTPWPWCEEWHDTAAAVGWPESVGWTLAYVMHRESGCQPGAHNPSGATGLMQLLGWSCPPGGCRDPWSNLAKALELWQGSGWCPWVLRGDPVTGRACG
jgi:hypothetical protein